MPSFQVYPPFRAKKFLSPLVTQVTQFSEGPISPLIRGGLGGRGGEGVSNYATIQKTTIQKTSCQSSYKTILTFSVSYYQIILHKFLFGTFLGSFYKIILHIFTEFISNNADTSRVSTKPYCKIILFCKFLSSF